MNVSPLGRRLLLLSALVASAAAGNARTAEIPKDRLRELQIEYAKVDAVSERPGAELLVEVKPLPGDAFTLRLPFAPNRITPVVTQGSLVQEGDVLARVSGPELAAWVLHADAVELQFADAQRRFTENRGLFERQAISSATWSDITQRYYELRDQMHHVEHTREVLRLSEHHTGADLLAPRTGLVSFSDLSVAFVGEFEVAHIAEEGALRASGLLAQGVEQRPVSLSLAACKIPIRRVENQASSLARRFWSAALIGCMEARPGVLLEGRLSYPFDGYIVPRKAIISLGGQAGVLLNAGNALEFVPVEISYEDRAFFYITSALDLDRRQVLVSSTSAVQGMLMGLGTD